MDPALLLYLLGDRRTESSLVIFWHVLLFVRSGQVPQLGRGAWFSSNKSILSGMLCFEIINVIQRGQLKLKRTRKVFFDSWYLGVTLNIFFVSTSLSISSIYALSLALLY